MTVYTMEFSGKIHMNGNTNEFNDFCLYYLDNKKKRVYREWELSHRTDLEPIPTFLISTTQRSIAATEREYYASAERMGKLFSDMKTHVTKLGEL